jgi:two-component system chemotaxis sensor kinase CheA
MVVEYPDVVSIKSLELSRNLRQLSRVTGELQKNAVSLRMVPIGAAFQKMSRLVRDLAISQAKSVQLVLEGEDVELDRNIVDKIGEPLIHLIRNAVDHGIEPPSKRLEDGKPEVGTVRLSAVHKRGGISIRIEDDGKGLDSGRIYKKAVDLGIISQGATLTEAEIFSLIFVAGMSTAATVTDVSGRGVGMDVVRETIQNLRGKIEIQSKPGKGTSFTIMLPLTLAIIDGLLVGSGNDRYIIPTLSVRESFRPKQDMLSSVHGRSEMVRVRGQQVPLVRLDRCLGSETEPVPATEGIIIVLESGDATRALLVDHLLGKQEVVIKNIGKIFDQQPLVAGGAILVDGRVGLLLDVEKIIHMNF